MNRNWPAIISVLLTILTIALLCLGFGMKSFTPWVVVATACIIWLFRNDFKNHD